MKYCDNRSFIQFINNEKSVRIDSIYTLLLIGFYFVAVTLFTRIDCHWIRFIDAHEAINFRKIERVSHSLWRFNRFRCSCRCVFIFIQSWKRQKRCLNEKPVVAFTWKSHWPPSFDTNKNIYKVNWPLLRHTTDCSWNWKRKINCIFATPFSACKAKKKKRKFACLPEQTVRQQVDEVFFVLSTATKTEK